MTTLKAMVTIEIPTAVETMTSLEIVNLINKGREITGGEAVLRHGDFMLKVPLVLGDLVRRKISSYCTFQDEATAHKRLADKNIRAEWFNLDSSDVNALIN